MMRHPPSIRAAAVARWRAVPVTLVALAAACALVGCNSSPTAKRAGNAPATQDQNGITVYGTVDAGVSRSR